MGIRGKPDQVFYYQGEGPGKTGEFFYDQTVSIPFALC